MQQKNLPNTLINRLGYFGCIDCITCNGGVDLATIRGLGPGSLNIVSTSWSPTSTSMSMAPGGQFGEWAGELLLEKALMIVPLSILFRPWLVFWPPLLGRTDVAEHKVDWLKLGWRML